MVLLRKVLTLSGSAQQLSGATTGITDLCRFVYLQPDNGNANIVKVGDLNVSSSDYAIELAKPVTNVPPAPVEIKGPIQLDSIWVLGTNTEKLRIGVVTM